MPTPCRGAGSAPIARLIDVSSGPVPVVAPGGDRASGRRARPRPRPLTALPPPPAPVTGLDADAGGDDTVAQLVETGVPTYLTIEALVEMACRSQRGVDWQSMYALVRRELVHMRLLPAHAPQLDPLRHTYQKIFADLLLTAHRASRPSPLADEPLFAPAPGLGVHSSRYRAEFDELSVLSRGGFAVVCRCRCRVDRQEYAVKRIPFRCRSPRAAERTVREVAVFASLSHPNIVKYNTAWLELETEPEAVVGGAAAAGESEPLASGDSQSSPDRDDSLVQFARGDSAVSGSLTNVTVRSQAEVEVTVERAAASGVSGVSSSKAKIVQDESSQKPSTESGDAKDESSQHQFQTTNFEPNSDSPVTDEPSNLEDPDSCRISVRRTTPRQPPVIVSDGAVVPVSGRFGSLQVKHPPLRRFWDVPSSSSSESSASARPVSKWKPPLAVTPTRWLTLHIQMQLCERTLKDWLSERNRRTLELSGGDPHSHVDADNKCTQILRDVLLGLHFIHQRGVIHRDLKPANIFLAFSGRALIGDFGLARPLGGGGGRAPLTPLSEHTGGVGTATYASPEQAAGAAYDHTADLYSLGVVMYELFVPFGTAMERGRSLQRLREQRDCCAQLAARRPPVAAAVLALTEPSPALRPCAGHLLASPLFTSPADRVLQLEEAALHQSRLLEARAARCRQLVDQLDSCRHEAAVTERLLRASCRRLRQQLAERDRQLVERDRQLAERDRQLQRLKQLLRTAGVQH